MRMIFEHLTALRSRLRRVGASRPSRTLTAAGAGVLAFALIAAGAQALRGVTEPRPDHPVTAGTHAAAMAPPASTGLVPAPVRAADGVEGPERAAPRLARREETGVTPPQASRLSRLFQGPPPAVPPARPPRSEPSAAGEPTAALRPRARPDGAGGLSVALRPRLRPADLPVDAPVRRVARRASEAESTAAASRPPETATVPAAPQVVRTSARCPSRLSGDMPRRARGADGASTVMSRLRDVSGVTRDAHATREILSGNMPDFLRDLEPVSLRGRAGDGSRVTITLCVMPDYLALGSEADYARIPLGLRAATRIGSAFDMMLPTPRMVDMIHRAAEVQLAPRPMPAGPQMRSTAYLMRHNATVEAQRARAGAAPGTLVSGHKKDVVLSTRLASRPGRVAIYGWHRGNGTPIQPLSTVHGAGYADYSHGVRLVSRMAYLDGRPVDLRRLLASGRYAGLLSDEGPVSGPRLEMAALAGN
jgi:hypothetical protein